MDYEGNIPSDDVWEPIETKILGVQRKFFYRTFNNGIYHPRFILVSIYGGHNQADPADFNFMPRYFHALPVWSVNIALWDSLSPIQQARQFDTEESMRDTHASYLKATSVVVESLRKQYPHCKIVLIGESFGGFFVTSYAFLQSVFESHNNLSNVYKPFAAQALEALFPDHRISPIDGFISLGGAINFMGAILQNPRLLKDLKVPGFYGQNYDDDRTPLESVRPFLENLLRSRVEIYIDRETAQDYGADIKFEALNRIDLPRTTVRGHFPPFHLSTEKMDAHKNAEYAHKMLNTSKR